MPPGHRASSESLRFVIRSAEERGVVAIDGEPVGGHAEAERQVGRRVLAHSDEPRRAQQRCDQFTVSPVEPGAERLARHDERPAGAFGDRPEGGALEDVHRPRRGQVAAACDGHCIGAGDRLDHRPCGVVGRERPLSGGAAQHPIESGLHLGACAGEPDPADRFDPVAFGGLRRGVARRRRSRWRRVRGVLRRGPRTSPRRRDAPSRRRRRRLRSRRRAYACLSGACQPVDGTHELTKYHPQHLRRPGGAIVPPPRRAPWESRPHSTPS